MWKKAIKFTIPLAIILLTLIMFIPGCGTKATTTPPTTSATATTVPPVTATEIVIGASRDITGPTAGFQEFGFAPLYKLWAQQINDAGGLTVGGKTLKIRIIEYDDGADNARVAANIEKLCTQDHVNFLFGPTGTTPLFAAAPIANKYHTIMLCGEGGATTLETSMPDLPYVFSPLNYSDHFQMPVFTDIMVAAGAKTAFICYLENLHGTEYNLIAQQDFTNAGINIVGVAGFPITITDMEPIVKAAEDSGADICCVFAYPDNNILFMNTAIALNYNPKALIIGPGCNFEFFNLTYGDKLEDVFGEGAWNRKSSAAANDLADMLIPVVGLGNMDWWGAIDYWGALQFFQQAIVKAGTLDNDVIKAVMETSHFQTVLGDTWWDCGPAGTGGGLFPQAVYAGQIGQWQGGVFEVVDPGSKRTADPVYPKPPFPAS
jgi:branched-chain amino acid transport system substrate-binding protein